MKIIRQGKDARESLKRGIDLAADCVGKTLGPSGRNFIIGRKFLTPLITNDGATGAKSIVPEDEIERLGAQMVTEASTTADEKVGDGTTTTTVLTQAIVNEGFAKLSEGESFIQDRVDSVAIRKEIDAACKLIVEELKARAVPISTPEEIENVAFVSVENRDIAKTVAELFSKIGKDGIVTIEDGILGITSNVVDGLELKSGLVSSYLANSGRQFVIDNPKILVTNHKIQYVPQIKSIAKKLHEAQIGSLIIIADSFSKEFLADCVANKLQNAFTIIPIQSPYFGDKERLTDIAMKLNTAVIDEDQKMSLDAISVDDLGTASKIVVTKDNTIIVGAKGDVSTRVIELKEDIEKTLQPFERKKLEERIAVLDGGIGVIKVGAESQAEREYWRLKVQDCVGATKAALQEGVVKGGGLALKEIAESLPTNILTEAIKTPYRLIQENAGQPFDIAQNIIDPVKVTRTALQTACSIAGVVITTEVAVADKDEEDDNNTRKDK